MEQKNGFNAVLFICNTFELVFVNLRYHEPDKNDWNAFVLLSKIKKLSQTSSYYTHVEAPARKKRETVYVRHYLMKVQYLVEKKCYEPAGTIDWCKLCRNFHSTIIKKTDRPCS